MQSLLVWVVTNNPSKKFYEKFNPEKIDTKFLERVKVEETAYCWRFEFVTKTNSYID